MYKVFYLDQVENDLKPVPSDQKRKILNRIERYLALAPKDLGKPLKGNFQGLWSYRYGDYRIIYSICDKEILIIVARISLRKDVYR